MLKSKELVKHMNQLMQYSSPPKKNTWCNNHNSNGGNVILWKFSNTYNINMLLPADIHGINTKQRAGNGGKSYIKLHVYT